jgi:hypothetical protein
MESEKAGVIVEAQVAAAAAAITGHKDHVIVKSKVPSRRWPQRPNEQKPECAGYHDATRPQMVREVSTKRAGARIARGRQRFRRALAWGSCPVTDPSLPLRENVGKILLPDSPKIGKTSEAASTFDFAGLTGIYTDCAAHHLYLKSFLTLSTLSFLLSTR